MVAPRTPAGRSTAAGAIAPVLARGGYGTADALGFGAADAQAAPAVREFPEGPADRAAASAGRETAAGARR